MMSFGAWLRRNPRRALIACILLMGLGIVMGNFVGGSVGSSIATILVVLGSMFGLAYLQGIRK